jgi:ribosomal protein L11 methyltransferase
MALHCAPQGMVILSGLLTEQAADICEAYVAQGFQQVAREDLGEWTALVMQRHQ